MPLDREQARAVLLESLPTADPKWGVWVDGILDRLEECVTPRLAEVDARLARIRALAEEPDAGDHDAAYVYAPAILEILDAPS